MPPKASTKAAPSESAHTYNESDIVLGKIKGYPAWPARVCDPASANKKVAKEKPTKGKNHYLVQFFPTGDFAWLPARDLSSLKEKEIDAFINGPGKKKADLMQGYTIAKDPTDWITAKDDEAAEHAKLEQDLMDAAENDELASDDEPATKKKGAKKDATKKRKRETNAAANGAKKDDKKKPKKDTAKTKAGVKKDYTDDEAEPASKKAKPSGDSDAEIVKSWRHKLQKVFLGKTDPPAEDMPKCAEIFDAMEKFEMKAEWLSESKLGKVLKRVALLKEDVIPDGDKYDFRKRSADLASKWSPLLNSNSATAGSPQADAAPSTDNKESTDAAPAPETENGATEEASAPAPEADAAPADEAPAAAPAAAEEKKNDEPEAMQVDSNGTDGDKKADEEQPKKDEPEEPATESST
ncbi:hypothetical protein JCM3766R1_004708 [Sporobolomyces carnicolor]